MSRAVVRVSFQGVLFVARWEGLRLVPYNDPVGNATVGVGHLLHIGRVTPADLDRFLGFTRAEALHLLRKDLLVAEDTLNTEVHPPVALQHRYDALASFIFNVGAGAFAHSSLRRRLNAGDRGVAAADELLRWNHAGGQVLHGLTRRRLAERALYLHADYGQAP